MALLDLIGGDGSSQYYKNWTADIADRESMDRAFVDTNLSVDFHSLDYREKTAMRLGFEQGWLSKRHQVYAALEKLDGALADSMNKILGERFNDEQRTAISKQLADAVRQHITTHNQSDQGS